MRRVGDELLPRVVELREPDAHAIEGDRQLADLVVSAVDDGRVEVTARDPLGGRLQPAQAVREHPGRGQAEDEREQEREGGRNEQTALDESHGRQRVRERRAEQDHGVLAVRDRHLGEVPGDIDHAAPLDATRLRRAKCGDVPRDIPRALPPARVGHDGERRLVGAEDAKGDHASIRRHPELLDLVVPEQRVERQLVREWRGLLLELVEPRVDELPLERRHDDEVCGTERSRHDRDEPEREANSDPARDLHA